MMAKVVLGVVCVALIGANGNVSAQPQQSLDDVLTNPQVVQSVKALGLAILSQGDPAIAEHDAAELRRSFWASRPDAGLTEIEAEVALKEFDRAWQVMAGVVREREIKSIQFVGMDLVLLKRSLDWYYGVATPRGPVLIRFSVQYNQDAPMSIHGVRVWTDWEEIKGVTRQLDLRAESKVMTITANPAAKSPPATRPAR